MYKLGDTFKAEFTKPEEAKGYYLGQYVTIFDGTKPQAKYVVEHLTNEGLEGTILVTYGHKRGPK